MDDAVQYSSKFSQCQIYHNIPHLYFIPYIIYSMYTCTVCYDDVIIQEVSTEELQAAGDVTLDKKTIEQLKQAHKELKVQLQTANRTLERKKAMLEKQKEQNKETVEKTAALQVSNVHSTSTYIHTYIRMYIRV